MTEYVVSVVVTPKEGSNLKVVIRGEAYPNPDKRPSILSGIAGGYVLKDQSEPVRIAQEIEEVDTNDREAVLNTVKAMEQRLITACDKRARYLNIVESYNFLNFQKTYTP
jgi:hypothetical protein